MPSPATLLLALTLGGASALLPALSAPTRPAVQRGARAAALRMQQRWDDPILDESLPDPVFDNEETYKGNVPYGFSTIAESERTQPPLSGQRAAAPLHIFWPPAPRLALLALRPLSARSPTTRKPTNRARMSPVSQRSTAARR